MKIITTAAIAGALLIAGSAQATTHKHRASRADARTEQLNRQQLASMNGGPGAMSGGSMAGQMSGGNASGSMSRGGMSSGATTGGSMGGTSMGATGGDTSTGTTTTTEQPSTGASPQ